MSAEEATLIAGAVGGVLGIVGAVVGVMVGLFGERWLRRWGDVECRIEEGDWYVERGRGGDVKERRLRVAFINRKELPVTLSDVRIEFSKKGGEPLEEWARPLVRLVKEPGSLADERISKFAAVTLHPHILVPLEFSVVPEGGLCKAPTRSGPPRRARWRRPTARRS
jgi:hypothetical protein